MGLLDFLKKSKKYDADGFDADGFNRLGYDRMGYDKDGYDINGYNREGYNVKGIYKFTGRDADGYDEEGFNQEGIDRNGFNRNGFDAEGYDKDGFNRDGYDRKGFNRSGYDKDGYNKEGFNRRGFNAEGYDRDGYDKKGFNSLGYDRDGYDKKGYDVDGYNCDGYDKKGYDRAGYDKEGFNKSGYDKSGFNKKGYDKEGFDRKGYDKRGYNRSGFNKDGFDKNGYDCDGYDEEGYNKEGINRKGYDREGYDREGYNQSGYDKKGFDRSGVSRLGFHKSEFDADGYHKITGLDVYGYSRFGYNINGINKHTGRDRLGFNADGIDENGLNIWGFNLEEQKDRFGNDISLYDNDPQMTPEMCKAFEELYYQYMAGKNSVAIKLAGCYCYGKGTVKDFKKALRILVDVAFEYQDMDAIRDLADHFYIGDIIGQNIALSNYLNDIVDKKKIQSINQYKARQALEFQRPQNVGDKTYAEELKNLERVMRSINKRIQKCEAQIRSLDNDTSWMDFDQLQDWREKKARNLEERKKIEEYEQIKRRPYYARMDAKTSRGKETFYIGEIGYSDYEDPACNVLSVWSDVGARYRDSSRTTFTVNGYNYSVLLRRKLDIAHGELIDYYDEYTEDSDAAKADITNPYLLRILEQKRGEKNITNIIRSIQLNQNEIIEASFQSNIVIQGCAGSGKTMILLHRLANMKYNQKNYDWSKVKIITPNKDFTLFIDELSKNLKIEEIDKITLQEYYLSILEKYDNQHLERVTKGQEIITVSNFNYKNEAKKLRDESELELEIRKIIYSAAFRERIAKEASARKDGIKNFKEASEQFADIFFGIMEEMECKIPKRMPNYTCLLYSRVLFMYSVFGAIRSNEKMLCIDEGQDICEMQYMLLYEVNGKNTCLNVYGDLAQRIPDNVSLTSWDKLKGLLNATYYELNENYRNSEDIINYYGKKLGIKNGSFGIKTKPVEQFQYDELDILLKLQLLLGNRVVVISNSEQAVPESVLSLCKAGGIAENHISVMNVKQVKGLEFDTAFVFDDGMDKNEKYIAYTRALSELYVSSTVTGQRKKALDIKSEISKSKNTKISKPKKQESEFPLILCDEDAVFYEQTILYRSEDVFITLTYPEIIDDCFVLKMSLQINDTDWVSNLTISAFGFSFNAKYDVGEIPVYIPDSNKKEQIITTAIPLKKLPKEYVEAIVEESDELEYGFVLFVEYSTGDGEVHKERSSFVVADMQGEFRYNENEDNAEVEDDDEDSENKEICEEEFISITNLDEQNTHELLIVVRETWSNDFCFVVEKFDGQIARGSQYLNGNFHKRASYNRYWKEFAMYTGPSRDKIERQYEWQGI